MKTTFGWPLTLRRFEPAALAWAGAFFVFYALVFGAAASWGPMPRYRVGFAWEASIPLWPWTAAVYLSLNLMAVPVLLRFPTVALLRPVLLALGFELTVATAFFVAFPVVNGFHDPPATGVLALARSVALQHNYFPSLHVALACTGALLVGGAWMYLWALLIAISTLTTHQHYLVDVVGGMVLAAAGYALYRRIR